MLFLRAFFMMLFGVILLVMGGLFGAFLPFLVMMMFIGLGAILVIMSFLTIFLRAVDSTLYHLMEDPKAADVKWLYVHGDTEIIVAPAIREMEYQSYSKKLDAQIKEVKMYDFAGHKVRIVPEGIGHSVDLVKCIYAEVSKKKFKAKSLGKLREVLVKDEEKKEVKEESKKVEENKQEQEKIVEFEAIDEDKEEKEKEIIKEKKYVEITSKVDQLKTKEE